ILGDKVKVPELKRSVHYFCLLTSCGVYQKGAEREGVFGFLVNDIKREMRRSSRLTCFGCHKKGACVGCFVPRCRKKVHFPCGQRLEFVSQFKCPFPSYCPAHAPSQSLSPGLSPGLDLSLPQSCSVCLDPIDPLLSFSILKCPSCHSSWFHRHCVQRQAHSSGLFFFRCTLCNNKDQFQEEMLRLGIHIPERDASWELETGAYSELLEVYRHCDAETCECPEGRGHSAKTGYLEIIRCRLCGSRGTHRKCSGLRLETRDWACPDCTSAIDGKSLCAFCFRFTDNRTPFSSSPGTDGALQHFLNLLLRQIQDCEVFEGPMGCKNLALNAQALKEDLYFDIGVLLALALVHGAPCLRFFSPALYQLLFNFPQNQPLTLSHLTPAAQSISELQSVLSSCSDHLTLSGCNRPIKSLEERAGLVDDLIAFSLITRMQLPLQR
uniref:PHD-type domain-containing protein n=1 Tax=Periophthalmus magnuspinnatus TaxID=409849 RepID=A0A3B4AIN1_9GOBI